MSKGNNIEEKKKRLRQWLSAIEMAKIPKSERTCRKDEFENMIKASDVGKFSDLIFGNEDSKVVPNWNDGW